MEQDQRDQLDARKTEAEIRKLNAEIEGMRNSAIRGWVTVLSLVAGIIFTVYQIYQVTSNIAQRDKELAIESAIRSEQVYLDILPRISGIKVINQRWNANTRTYEDDTREIDGGVTQMGSYAAAVSLACRFEELLFPAKVAMEFQKILEPTDVADETLRQRVKKDCPENWDTLTEAEVNMWSKRASEGHKRRQGPGLMHPAP